MHRGATTLELIALLVIIGMAAGVMSPRVAHTLDRLAVERAAHDLATMHAAARDAARARHRVGVLVVRNDSVFLRMVDMADTVRVWTRAGPTTHGVKLDAPTRPVLFAPSGWSFGASNMTWRLTRGTAKRDVVVSRYGRVQVRP